MYSKLYRQASEVAEMIRSGEYDKVKGRVAKKETRSGGLMSPRPQKEEVQEGSELEFIASMIAKIRDINDSVVEDEPVKSSPTRGAVSGNFDPSEIGLRLKKDLMSDLGITGYQAAAIVGNLDHETGGFKFMQEIEPVVEGSRGGYGFAQWTGPRRVAFEEWSGSNNLDPSSYEANYGFLKHELTSTKEGDVLVNLSGAGNLEDATTIFSQEFLRPGKPLMDSRIQRAQRYK